MHHFQKLMSLIQALSHSTRFCSREDTATGEAGFRTGTDYDVDILVQDSQAATAHLHVFSSFTTWPDRQLRLLEPPPDECCYGASCSSSRLHAAQSSLSGGIWPCHDVMTLGGSERGGEPDLDPHTQHTNALAAAVPSSLAAAQKIRAL